MPILEHINHEEHDIAHQMLSAVFDSTPDGLVVLDDFLMVQQANPSFIEFVGKPLTVITGRFIGSLLMSHELVPALHRLLTDVTAPTRVELTITQPVKRSFSAHIARLQAHDVRGWVIVLHDQTERKRLDYQKMEFVNIAAHELRTPLTHLLGFTQLLLHNPPQSISPDQMEWLQSILAGGCQLRQIVDEMIEFSHLHRGSLEYYNIADFQVVDLIEDVITDVQQQALEKRVILHTEIADSAMRLHSDRVLLRTILTQLIVNGINFNVPGGSVQIAASQVDDQSVFRVIDKGIGIPATDLDAIFSPFYQVEDHRKRRVGGLGLGLSIAKRATAQLGGSLSVESAVDEGTTFTLRVPVRHTSFNPQLAALQARLDTIQQQSHAYERDIQALYLQQQQHAMATLTTIAEVIEARDVYFRSHTDRVTNLALRIAKRLGYSELELRTLEVACRIQDIGKIGIPDIILNKVGPLTDAEELIMRQHVALGRKITEPLPFLKDALPIAFSHHERWDGQGYPDGLVGEAIPLGGRILAVADAYDAMVSPRSYRAAMSNDQARATLQADAGHQWDPVVVAAFLSLGG